MNAGKNDRLQHNSSSWSPIHATHIQASRPLMKLQSFDSTTLLFKEGPVPPVPWPPANIGTFVFRQNCETDHEMASNSSSLPYADFSFSRFVKKQTTADILQEMKGRTAFLLSRTQSPAESHQKRLELTRLEEDTRFYAEMNVNLLAEAFPESTYTSDCSDESGLERYDQEAITKDLQEEELRLERGDTDMRSLFGFDVPLKGVRLEDEVLNNRVARKHAWVKQKAEQLKTTRSSLELTRNGTGSSRNDSTYETAQTSGPPRSGTLPRLKPLSTVENPKVRSYSDSTNHPRSWLVRQLTSSRISKTSPASPKSPSLAKIQPATSPLAKEVVESQVKLSITNRPRRNKAIIYRDIHSPWPSIFIPENAIEEDGDSDINSSIESHRTSESKPSSQGPPHQPQDLPVPHHLLTLTINKFTTLIDEINTQWAQSEHACRALATHAVYMQRHAEEIATRLEEMQQRYMDAVAEVGELKRAMIVKGAVVPQS